MKLVHSLSLALAITAIGSPAFAAQYDPHQSHHPATAAPATAALSCDSKSMSGSTSSDMGRMHAQMTAMHEMHEKMMAAKTPRERKALMAENMKMMQDGMNMMSEMSPEGQNGMACDTTARDQAMEERMQMMQVVMQMMMDRLPPKSVE